MSNLLNSSWFGVNNLIRYYKFDNNLLDDTNNNDITDLSAPAITFGTGKINQSSIWNGSSTKGSGSGLAWSDGAGTDRTFTYNFFIKLTDGSGTQFICSRKTNNTTLAGWALIIVNNILSMELYSSDTTTNKISVSSTTLTNGVWYSISIKYDASKTAAGLTMKIDNGTPIVSIETGTYVANEVGGSLFWGVHGIGSPGSIFWFDGELDLFRIFNSNISDAEETFLYNSGNGRN